MERNFKRPIWAVLFSLALTFVSCSEEQGPQPLESNSKGPGVVENINVENLPGKAKLTYTLPIDQDLLYVRATYTLENGTPMEVKASYYNNTMLLEGFSGNGGQPINVNITAVNRSESSSTVVTVPVEPLLAPIFDVAATINASADFGGVRIKATNANEDNIAILVLAKNKVGDWEVSDNSIYTSAVDINKNVRGYDNVETEFAIVVRDRWSNVTDTIKKTLTPFFEELIPTVGYSAVSGLAEAGSYGNEKSFLWDGQFYWPRVWVSHREDTSQENHTVTIDMGVLAKLSRVRIWDYLETGRYYFLGSLRKFEIWGTAGSPGTNGSDDTGWTKLGDYEVIKPSGLPYGSTNNEDVLFAQGGWDFDISLEADPIRYIKIRAIESWSGNTFLALAEINFYGGIIE